ncbi:NADH-cytochrome b-5 reductase [Xylariaceae sp. FL0016]|nr:NADH-cytochrome b-5 reductase [Xylariaceae sp. FL0016]
MASADPKPDHLERTAAEPRDPSIHIVILRRVDQISDDVRLFQLEIPKDRPPVRFLPGQWLDVHVPGVPTAGGFTITSPPAKARSSTPGAPPGYLELAVQKSPDNPPAAWLWRDVPSIQGQPLHVRVGGSFVWPPPGINARSLRRAVFVAGGVGVNPLVSMLSAIASSSSSSSSSSSPPAFEVDFLYSVRGPRRRSVAEVPFLARLAAVFAAGKVKGRLRLFMTGGDAGTGEGVLAHGDEDGSGMREEKEGIAFMRRRITVDDVAETVGGPDERRFAVVYVCGVPTMTDEFVAKLTDRGGLAMESHRVLCEKWW